jgi:hypothetical protein
MLILQLRNRRAIQHLGGISMMHIPPIQKMLLTAADLRLCVQFRSTCFCSAARRAGQYASALLLVLSNGSRFAKSFMRIRTFAWTPTISVGSECRTAAMVDQKKARWSSGAPTATSKIEFFVPLCT